jgi:hypothetical protein
MSRIIRITFLLYTVLYCLTGVLVILMPRILLSEGWPVSTSNLMAPVGIATLFALGAGSYLGYRSRYWKEVKLLVLTQIAFSGIATLIYALSASILTQSWLLWIPALVFAISTAYWTYILQLGSRCERPRGIDLKEFR